GEAAGPGAREPAVAAFGALGGALVVLAGVPGALLHPRRTAAGTLAAGGPQRLPPRRPAAGARAGTAAGPAAGDPRHDGRLPHGPAPLVQPGGALARAAAAAAGGEVRSEGHD